MTTINIPNTITTHAENVKVGDTLYLPASVISNQRFIKVERVRPVGSNEFNIYGHYIKNGVVSDRIYETTFGRFVNLQIVIQ